MLNKLKYWIPLALVITTLFGFVYVVNQQILRQSANDPQIQMSEDVANALSQRQKISSIFDVQKIDISKSASPYLILYSENGDGIESTGVLDGKIPTLPKGVYDYTRQNHQDRITWQPSPRVRSAIVITHYTDGTNAGFVLAGRSLREVEIRENQVFQYTVIGWVATMVTSLLAALIFIPTQRKSK